MARPTWATDANYTSGPDIGTPTQNAPTVGDMAEGFVPGAGADPTLVNYLLGYLFNPVAQTLYPSITAATFDLTGIAALGPAWCVGVAGGWTAFAQTITSFLSAWDLYLPLAELLVGDVISGIRIRTEVCNNGGGGRINNATASLLEMRTEVALGGGAITVTTLGTVVLTAGAGPALTNLVAGAPWTVTAGRSYYLVFTSGNDGAGPHLSDTISAIAVDLTGVPRF